MDAQGVADMVTETNITTPNPAEWPRRRLLRRLRVVDQFAVDFISQALLHN